MESKIYEILRLYSSKRIKLIDKLQSYFPLFLLPYIQHGLIYHFLLIFSSIYITIKVFIQCKKISLFSFHPLFMAFGCLLFIGEGIVAYRNRNIVDTLGPIMQHSNRAKVRSIHQTCQVVGGSMVLLGLLFILSHKIDSNKSLISASIHSILGIIVLFLITTQIIVGTQKINSFNHSFVTIRRWHGEAGLLTWDCIIITILSGILQYLPMSISTFLLVLLIYHCWLLLHIQMKRKAIDSEEDEENSNDIIDQVEIEMEVGDIHKQLLDDDIDEFEDID